MSAEASELVSIPRAELDALKAELKRLRRAMLAGGGGGALYLDTLKNNRARTVPLVVGLTCGRPPGLSGTSRGHLSRPGHLTRRTTRRRRTTVPGESGCSGGAAYRNRTDDLRITRGLLPRSYYMTCTDSTANGSDDPDCTGISLHPVPRPVPRFSHRATGHRSVVPVTDWPRAQLRIIRS